MNVRLRFVLLPLLWACSAADFGLATDAAELSKAARPITIIHVNDSHASLDSFGPKDASLGGTLGGLTRAATVIERIRRGAPNTLFLHAGDFFEGDLTFPATQGVLELSLLQRLGLDAITLGNHEFDYGPTLLAQTLEGGAGSFAVLSANLVKPPEDHPLSPLVTSHVVKVVNGVRVGIFGLTLPNDLLMQTAPFAISADLIPIVQSEVAALRPNADVIVLLSHLGFAADHLIADTPDNGVDVIVGGHDEWDETFESYVPGKAIIVRAGHFYQRVGKLDLVVKGGKILQAHHQLIPIDDSVERNPDVVAALQPVADAVSASLGFDAFHQPIAFAPVDIPNEWDASMGARRDMPMGDLAADAIKTALGADLGFITGGFLNDRIYAGPVVANDLFRALPYGISASMLGPYPDMVLPEPVLKLELTPEQLGMAIEYAISVAGEIPQPSEGVFICYDSSASPAVQLVRIAGEPKATYTLATNIVIAFVMSQALGIELPQFDPAVSQFSTLVSYAAGKTLLPAAEPRVLDTTACADD